MTRDNFAGAIKRVSAVFLISISGFGSQPPSLYAQLLAHNIEWNEPALLKALTNSDPEIRALAGLKLTSSNDSLALASVENALVDEKQSDTRVLLAFTLASINNSKGFESLLPVCSDESVASSARVKAAVSLADLKNFSCLATELAMTKTDDRNAQTLTLYGLTTFRAAGADSKPLVAAAKVQLRSSDAMIRLLSASILRMLDYSGFEADLTKAISTEADPLVRFHMQQLTHNHQ